MHFHELSALQRDLLVVVAGVGPASGQEVKAELQSTLGVDLLPGVLYSNLDDLVDAGLVEKGKRDGRTNRYVVTDAGRATLDEMFDWQRSFDGVEAM